MELEKAQTCGVLADLVTVSAFLQHNLELQTRLFSEDYSGLMQANPNILYFIYIYSQVL